MKYFSRYWRWLNGGIGRVLFAYMVPATAVLLGVAFSVAHLLPSADAQGGFPSRPMFQAVGVNTTPETNGFVLSLKPNSSSTTDGWVGFRARYNTNSFAFCLNGVAAACDSGEAVGDADIEVNNGTLWFYNGGTPKKFCLSDGTNCPSGRAAYGLVFNEGSSTCALNTSASNAGISSCTVTATGNWNVSFSTAFSVSPICNVTVNNGTGTGGAPYIVSVLPNTSGVQIGIENLSGTLTDPSGLEIHCVGS